MDPVSATAASTAAASTAAAAAAAASVKPNSWLHRVLILLGPRGYEPFMRRSLQTVVLYEAKRCVAPRLQAMRPFQRKVALLDQAQSLVNSMEFLLPHYKSEILWRTATSREIVSADIAWKRHQLIQRELDRLAGLVKQYAQPGRTHLQACDLLEQYLFETVGDNQGKTNEGRKVPANWGHAHNHVLMCFRLYYNFDILDPEFPSPNYPKELVVPMHRPSNSTQTSLHNNNASTQSHTTIIKTDNKMYMNNSHGHVTADQTSMGGTNPSSNLQPVLLVNGGPTGNSYSHPGPMNNGSTNGNPMYLHTGGPGNNPMGKPMTVAPKPILHLNTSTASALTLPTDLGTLEIVDNAGTVGTNGNNTTTTSLIEYRRKLLTEVREHLELLKEFEGVISPQDLAQRKRELFLALPPAPPPAPTMTSGPSESPDHGGLVGGVMGGGHLGGNDGSSLGASGVGMSNKRLRLSDI